MRPVWLIEADVFGESSEGPRAEIRRRGMHAEVVRHAAWDSIVRSLALEDGACVLFRGSFPLMRQIQLHHAWVPGGWCSVENFGCETYYAHFGRFMLNHRYMMLPGVEAIRLRDWLYELFGRGGEVFARPTGCQKLFTGRRIGREQFVQALAPTRYDPTTLVLIAEPQPVDREWRLVVAGDSVVAASQYLTRGQLDVAPGCPEAVRSFAAGILQEVSWRPDPVFVMDVCESESELYLVELNSFSCSGLYACDLPAVVAAASDLASEQWERYRAVTTTVGG